MGAPVRLQKAIPGSKENAAVERREANAQRYWACAAKRNYYGSVFRRSALPHLWCGRFPLVGEGMEMPAYPAPYKKQGRRSFGCFGLLARRLFDM